MKQRIVFVLGMHRSGTSLVTKGTQVLGADLGTRLMPPGPDNPTGFWEDFDVYHLNQAVLAALDLDWDVASIVPPNARELAALDALQVQARELLARRMTGATLIAIKDPRFSLTLPLWLTAVEALDLEPRLLLVVRNPLDVAASLTARNGLEQARGLQLWLSANLSLARMLTERGQPVLCVSYERFLGAVETEMARLAEFLQDAPPSDEQRGRIAAFAREFVAPELCHSRSSVRALEALEATTPGLAALYGSLVECCEGAWDARRVLTDIEGIDLLGVEARNLRQQRGLDRRLQRQLEQARDALTEELRRVGEEASQREERMRAEGLRREEQMRADHEERMRVAQEVHQQVLHQQTAAFMAQRRELQHWRRSQQATERHLNGALQSLAEIRASLSVRLGFGLTWPIRRIYDLLRGGERLSLMARMLYYLICHPVRALGLINRERVANAYLIFFRHPGMAREVVGHYARLLHGEELAAPVRQASAAPVTVPSMALERMAGKVSVITVNYNGKVHLDGLLRSLLEQDYDDLEVILVDNGSVDGSVDFVRECYPSVKVVALAENLGFAEANNIGAQIADGAYYCLINNDMELERNAIRSLVSRLQADSDVAAVGPKIRFWKPFVRLALHVKGPAAILDQEALERTLPVYSKLFFGPGWITAHQEGRVLRGLTGESYLEVPACTGQSEVVLTFQAGQDKSSVTVMSHPSLPPQRLDLQPGQSGALTIDLASAAHLGAARYLINNAASEVDDQGNARDRGFAMPDDGSFDQADEVTALCGGAMLIRAAALQGQPIFAGEFFAYYEDTELSMRLRDAGYRLLYVPASVVYHKHASTSREYSAFFRYYVTRNQILFQALHFPESVWRPCLEARRGELNHLKKYYQEHAASPDEREFASRIPDLLRDWDRLLPKIVRGEFHSWPSVFPRMAIYNGFWDTLGGGEHHAGVMALALQRFGLVDLLSDRDFDIESLERQFDLDLKHCRKRVVTAPELHFNPDVTRHYDLLINSTFSSDLICHAKTSVYVVSFPFRLGLRKRQFLDSYDQFWANSKFTAQWLKTWWDVESEVVYPSIRLPNPPAEAAAKERCILHVGRFFRVGHSKKQLELVTAFTELVDAGELDENWRLVLVGKVHRDQEDYLHEVQRRAQGYHVDFITDASFFDLHDLFRRSAIYWHATGIGEDEQEHPEVFEHFGISTVEAMSYGCVPVVIGGGGQRETVSEGVNGYLFRDLSELKAKTMNCVRAYEGDRATFERISECAMDRARQFSRETEVARVTDLVKELGLCKADRCTLL